MAEYVLETKDLGISFGGLKAVENVDLKIKKKQLYGLVGPNGAGKTITRFTFGQIDMVNAKDQLSFTVTLSGGEIFQVTTGIEEYVASAVGGRQSAVIQALQKYVDSVIRVVGNK